MRLIDADELRKIIHLEYSDDLEILEKIDNAPTVENDTYKAYSKGFEDGKAEAKQQGGWASGYTEGFKTGTDLSDAFNELKIEHIKNFYQEEPPEMSPNYDYIVGWNEALDAILRELGEDVD